MGKPIQILAAACCLAASCSAHADRLPLPADTPAAYRNECGSCHLAFPPQLRSAPEWRRLLAGLDRHFGADASLDAGDRAAIARFLEGAAGRRAGDGGDPPRLTRGRWFQREHREVPARLWQDPRVKSAANCEACHGGAAQGRYSEHDLVLPELKRREK